jgi:hypothetical protein
MKTAMLFMFLALPLIVFGESAPKDLSLRLKMFRENPKIFMHLSPWREGATSSNKKKMNSSHRNKFRQEIINSSRTAQKSMIENHEQPQLFLERPDYLINIEKMSDANLINARLEVAPWSDDYWAIYNGVLGARYADKNFNTIKGWDMARNYVEAKTAAQIFATNNAEEIDQLSPSEKYDLLFGIENSSLTRASWQEGRNYFEANGEVETWMGICHGWAPAAYMVTRPINKISVPAFDGKTMINFYPADLKALTSLLWAKTRFSTSFIGGRCNNKEPKMDETGRITDNECFDINPGAWHISTVNRIGVEKKSFVLDATFDYEVWNQPVLGYRYRYFNPETSEATNVLSNAIIKIEDFKSDKFKKFRSALAKKIVGVEMMLEYVVETDPEHRVKDDVKFDRSQRVYYLYDLELDEQNNIIGGEWYQNTHPDFLWTPTQNAKALTTGDMLIYNLPNWDGKASLASDRNWTYAAEKSARQGQPLAKLIESLINLSQSNNPEGVTP